MTRAGLSYFGSFFTIATVLVGALSRFSGQLSIVTTAFGDSTHPGNRWMRVSPNREPTTATAPLG
jgi:hypothetical protein